MSYNNFWTPFAFIGGLLYGLFAGKSSGGGGGYTPGWQQTTYPGSSVWNGGFNPQNFYLPTTASRTFNFDNEPVETGHKHIVIERKCGSDCCDKKNKPSEIAANHKDNKPTTGTPGVYYIKESDDAKDDKDFGLRDNIAAMYGLDKTTNGYEFTANRLYLAILTNKENAPKDNDGDINNSKAWFDIGTGIVLPGLDDPAITKVLGAPVKIDTLENTVSTAEETAGTSASGTGTTEETDAVDEEANTDEGDTVSGTGADDGEETLGEMAPAEESSDKTGLTEEGSTKEEVVEEETEPVNETSPEIEIKTEEIVPETTETGLEEAATLLDIGERGGIPISVKELTENFIREYTPDDGAGAEEVTLSEDELPEFRKRFADILQQAKTPDDIAAAKTMITFLDNVRVDGGKNAFKDDLTQLLNTVDKQVTDARKIAFYTDSDKDGTAEFHSVYIDPDGSIGRTQMRPGATLQGPDKHLTEIANIKDDVADTEGNKNNARLRDGHNIDIKSEFDAYKTQLLKVLNSNSYSTNQKLTALKSLPENILNQIMTDQEALKAMDERTPGLINKLILQSSTSIRHNTESINADSTRAHGSITTTIATGGYRISDVDKFKSYIKNPDAIAAFDTLKSGTKATQAAKIEALNAVKAFVLKATPTEIEAFKSNIDRAFDFGTLYNYNARESGHGQPTLQVRIERALGQVSGYSFNATTLKQLMQKVEIE